MFGDWRDMDDQEFFELVQELINKHFWIIEEDSPESSRYYSLREASDAGYGIRDFHKPGGCLGRQSGGSMV